MKIIFYYFRQGGTINWNDLNSNKSFYEPRNVYAQSKLCNILFTRELAERLEGTKVTVNALHPGVVKTELWQYLQESYGILSKLLLIIIFPIILITMKSAKQGAQTSIYCAVSPDLNETTGCYFADCKIEKLLPHASNQEDAQKLWALSEKLIELSSK